VLEDAVQDDEHLPRSASRATGSLGLRNQPEHAILGNLRNPARGESWEQVDAKDLLVSLTRSRRKPRLRG
jgi:hypothetical protein